jgi:hypothetical protein
MVSAVVVATGVGVVTAVAAVSGLVVCIGAGVGSFAIRTLCAGVVVRDELEPVPVMLLGAVLLYEGVP